MANKALVMWMVTALSIVAFVAGFNIFVDPFGYFGWNRIGYYFSSERQFKYSLVKSYDYNAILLGDSRIAYTDTSAINRPEYTFLNGGIGGASVAEQVALLSASRLDRLRLAVFGLQIGDLAHCMETPTGGASAPDEYGSWDALRFAASWTQATYAVDALLARAHGRSPSYHPDGSRSVVSNYFREAALDEKTERYWNSIEANVPTDQSYRPQFDFGPRCQKLLGEARRLAKQHDFSLLVIFLPQNVDLLERLNWDTPEVRGDIGKFVAEVKQAVPHFVDLSRSSFSASRGFWLNDSTHFKPLIGAQIIDAAISQTIGAQASR